MGDFKDAYLHQRAEPARDLSQVEDRQLGQAPFIALLLRHVLGYATPHGPFFCVFSALARIGGLAG